MTIRKTLLAAFLSVGLVSSMLLASLAFIKARAAVRTEIEGNLAVQASVVAQDVDKMMFERLQNAATWRHLDVMQDLQVRDIDKRLARFLSDLKRGYGDVYIDLSCADTQGRIISSSDAARTYRVVSDRPPWLRATVADTTVALALPDAGPPPGVVMRVPLTSSYGGGALGELRLRLDWRRFFDVLDDAGAGGERMLAVLDRDGRVIAASSALRQRGLLLSRALADWRRIPGPTAVVAGAPLVHSDVIVGVAASHGYGQFAGLGWTTLVIQPTDQAFAPVRHMALIFAGLMALITVFTVVLASWVSRAIALPITALTAFARSHVRHQSRLAPPSGGSGEVGELTQAFVQMVHDIDQSQRNLVSASKLAVVGEMSSVIAHEVRTPLGILRSSAQMLQREAGISAEGRELLGFIASETERLNSLVSAMLDTARPRPIQHGPVDMHALLRKCVAMLVAQADRKRIQIREQLLAPDPVIACDEEQMTQVVLNLLMNGLQILHDDGRIELSSRSEGDWLCIDIADDGPGIDPAERARVFEAFFFKREGGIGLGLAIVQQIVHAHGGEIQAQESPLGGALFHIRLPRTQTPTL